MAATLPIFLLLVSLWCEKATLQIPCLPGWDDDASEEICRWVQGKRVEEAAQCSARNIPGKWKIYMPKHRKEAAHYAWIVAGRLYNEQQELVVVRVAVVLISKAHSFCVNILQWLESFGSLSCIMSNFFPDLVHIPCAPNWVGVPGSEIISLSIFSFVPQENNSLKLLVTEKQLSFQTLLNSRLCAIVLKSYDTEDMIWKIYSYLWNRMRTIGYEEFEELQI